MQNLNPSTTLYAVTGPFVLHTQRSLTVRTLALYFVLVLMLTLVVVPAGCLIHNAFRKSDRARVSPGAGP